MIDYIALQLAKVEAQSSCDPSNAVFIGISSALDLRNFRYRQPGRLAQIFDAVTDSLASLQSNLLTITGKKQETASEGYLHRGIAGRPFEHRFELADHVRVNGADLKNGLLSIDLVREIPEALKPRKIDIQTDPAVVQSTAPMQIEAPKAA